MNFKSGNLNVARNYTPSVEEKLNSKGYSLFFEKSCKFKKVVLINPITVLFSIDMPYYYVGLIVKHPLKVRTSILLARCCAYI